MIRVEGLTKRFGPVVAVDQLSFSIERGESFAMIGPNGAGKTTALKAILGLTRPDAGTIAIGARGLPPSEPEARRELGYVPQRVSSPPGRTVEEVLGFFARLRGLPRSATGDALKRVGLESIATRAASQLSGGYTQRLCLAQALLGNPELLVLDEPTASLDPESTWEFRTLLDQLRREGRTILLCSHLLSEVERVADRVLILVQGRSAALEPLSLLRERQVNATRLVIEMREEIDRARSTLESLGHPVQPLDGTRLVLDAANGQGLAALEALRRGGLEVRSFEMQRPTLEEIFMDVVRRERGERGGA